MDASSAAARDEIAGDVWHDLPATSSVEPRPMLGPVHIESVAARDLIAHRIAWDDLAGRALEPNIFLEPGFAIPLLDHVLTSPKLRFLLVWEEPGAEDFGRLVGLLPATLAGGALRLAGIARGLTYNQVCSGVPLLDRDHADAVLGAALDWTGTRSAGALVLEQIPQEGAFFAALTRHCAGAARRVTTLEEYRRAVLRRRDGDAPASPSISAKRRKEQARLSRRLSEMGQRTYTSARTAADVAVAAERYLQLEHQGWKGAWGTSLLSNPTLTSFLRDMTRDLAHEGKCRIDAIELDGAPVAMGIVLSTDDRSYFWKTAFDERFAALSPGVQFTSELTQVQLADAACAATDSCAIADHPMIDRVWADRHAISHLAVEMRPRSGFRYDLACGVERLRRDLRARAKLVLSRLRAMRARAETGAGCKTP